VPIPLTKDDVARRLQSLPMESYALIANVAKGIALGVGSLVLLQIFAHLTTEWMRLFPWCASLLAILISYLKWNRGTLLTNSRSNIWDSIFPLSLGVAEFILFAVLVTQGESLASDQDSKSFLWFNWTAVLAVHALLASGLVANRLRLTNVGEDFDGELSDIGLKYKSWLVKDMWQAGAAGLVALVVWIFNWAWVFPRYGGIGVARVQTGFAFLCIIGAWKPLLDANLQRNQTDKFVSDLLSESAGK
jgi:hypothetical protein